MDQWPSHIFCTLFASPGTMWVFLRWEKCPYGLYIPVREGMFRARPLAFGLEVGEQWVCRAGPSAERLRPQLDELLGPIAKPQVPQEKP